MWCSQEARRSDNQICEGMYEVNVCSLLGSMLRRGGIWHWHGRLNQFKFGLWAFGKTSLDELSRIIIPHHCRITLRNPHLLLCDVLCVDICESGGEPITASWCGDNWIWTKDSSNSARLFKCPVWRHYDCEKAGLSVIPPLLIWATWSAGLKFEKDSWTW